MGRVKTTFTNAVQRNKQSERDTNVIQKVTHPLSSFCVGQKKKKIIQYSWWSGSSGRAQQA
jgi:hypothetical protein